MHGGYDVKQDSLYKQTLQLNLVRGELYYKGKEKTLLEISPEISPPKLTVQKASPQMLQFVAGGVGILNLLCVFPSGKQVVSVLLKVETISQSLYNCCFPGERWSCTHVSH